MTRTTIVLFLVLLLNGSMGASGAVAESGRQAEAIPADDYALYDQVVTSKFLTSTTQLVVIQRMTRLRLSPDQEVPTTIGVFKSNSISIVNCRRISFGNSSQSIRAKAGSKGDFTLLPTTGLPQGIPLKSRRCPWPIQSR